jgi:hypothetical protein
LLSALPSFLLALLLPLLPLLLSLLLAFLPALLPLLLPVLLAVLLAVPTPVAPGSVATPAFSPAAPAGLVAAASVSSAHAFLLLRVIYTTA